MQKGLLDTNSAIHVDGSMLNEIIDNANQNIEKSRRNEIPVIFIKNEWTNPFMNFFTQNVCKAGTEQSQIDSRINYRTEDIVFIKKVRKRF
jgi:nicotinamidase-related amidase